MHHEMQLFITGYRCFSFLHRLNCLTWKNGSPKMADFAAREKEVVAKGMDERKVFNMFSTPIPRLTLIS